MNQRPAALDLYCGGGGAARGLIASGFDVVGVDRADHSISYPGWFVRGDALRPPMDLSRFDLVWASPPCQAFSVATPPHKRDVHPDLIEATRRVLSLSRRSVMENVPGAPIRRNIVLDGPTVGLFEIARRRVFELRGFWMWQPVRPRVTRARPPIEASVRGGKRSTGRGRRGNRYVSKAQTARALGLPTDCPMTCREMGESVPPAYAELIGRAAIESIRREERGSSNGRARERSST